MPDRARASSVENRSYAILAGICERMGWELELDSFGHDHGFDREGNLTIRTPEVFCKGKAAGEDWDGPAWRMLDELRAIYDPLANTEEGER